MGDYSGILQRKALAEMEAAKEPLLSDATKAANEREMKTEKYTTFKCNYKRSNPQT